MQLEKAGQLFKDIKKLEKKYSLSYEEIINILGKKEKISIPFSIFNNKLGSLESIVKFLKENLSLNIKEISFLTNRKQQPIRTTYLRASKKYSVKLIADGEKNIPLDVIANNKLSVLENIISYLLSAGYSINEISLILKRDYQTIWTIKNRIKART
jgi:hypothetical protein